MATPDQGAGVASFKSAAIFDDSVANTNVNLRSDRAANQSPIDNTKAQITNLGSQDHAQDPAATGATGISSTIGGGDDNSASGDFSTVPGGRANIASADDTFAVGQGCQAIGPQNIAMGAYCIADGPGSGDDGLGGAVALGHRTVATGVHAFAANTSNQALGNASAVFGGNNTAAGDHAFVAGGIFGSAGGDDSFSSGSGNASGSRSFSHNSTASGTNSTGFNGTASADRTVAFNGTASAIAAVAFNGIASAADAVAFSNGQASGAGAFAASGQNIASGKAAFSAGGDAIGGTNRATGDFAAVGGGANNLADGDWSSISGGSGNHAAGDGSAIAGGQNNGAIFGMGVNAFAANEGNNADGEAAAAFGNATRASGFAAFSIGQGSFIVGGGVASGESSFVHGAYANAIRYGQRAFASGTTSGLSGLCQSSENTMAGQTDGSPGASTELTLSTGPFEFEDGRSYTVKITANASVPIAGVLRSRAFELSICVVRVGGVSTIVGTGPSASYGSAQMADCSLVATIGAAPDRLVLTYTAGAAGTFGIQARCFAHLAYHELFNPPP